ncbi:MAG: UDP-N-acetylmuramate--L-alanine ligase [Lachnospiraceae bacterium]|jgi:UDP-N-acetylmuramate--alanine ligase|nr:UDP-N-acetylmuramate--L-alanine ligase [Lachnospiraceae bacterium]
MSGYKIDFNLPIHVHFIGIGGISMSGLAEVLLDRGFKVSGSDVRETNHTKKLADNGANIIYKQEASNITEDIDLVVITAAIHDDNPEYMEAIKKDIPVLQRSELLGQMMDHFDVPIAIAGTHGKTTTTSIISHVLLNSHLNPTISVGGDLDLIGGNIHVGGSDIFLTEACEYHNSFLDFNPKISVILNVDNDHLDFFGTKEKVVEAFKNFAHRLPKDGHLIINSGIKEKDEIIEDLDADVITYGFDSSSDYSATNFMYDENGYPSFDFVKHGMFIRRMELSVVGLHNVSNALVAIIIGDLLGLDGEEVAKSIKEYGGVHRRFEEKGTVNGFRVVDDYAHHPTEIGATIEAARHVHHNELWIVFQPHTYTRTQEHFDNFVKELSKADHVILAEIYAARETDTLGMSSKLLSDTIKEQGTDSIYFENFKDIEDYILKNVHKGDLLITMGAGNVVTVADDLIKS